MNNIEKALDGVNSIGEFSKEYFFYLSKVLKSISEDEINKLGEVFELARLNGNTIFVAGNGGSCSDAEHFAGELVCTFKNRKRKGISAIPLTSHSAAITAWANDFKFESYFERQVVSNGQRNDILFLLSTGGGNLKNKASLNLVYAALKAKKKKLKVISLVGKNGGELKKISDICIHVKETETSIIQECHMSILHCICLGLEEKLK